MTVDRWRLWEWCTWARERLQHVRLRRPGVDGVALDGCGADPSQDHAGSTAILTEVAPAGAAP